MIVDIKPTEKQIIDIVRDINDCEYEIFKNGKKLSTYELEWFIKVLFLKNRGKIFRLNLKPDIFID